MVIINFSLTTSEKDIDITPLLRDPIALIKKSEDLKSRNEHLESLLSKLSDPRREISKRDSQIQYLLTEIENLRLDKEILEYEKKPKYDFLTYYGGRVGLFLSIRKKTIPRLIEELQKKLRTAEILYCELDDVLISKNNLMKYLMRCDFVILPSTSLKQRQKILECAPNREIIYPEKCEYIPILNAAEKHARSLSDSI